MQQSSETGLPALRPLFLNYPHDKNVAGMDDEFLFGDDLLAAPVLHQGEKERSVYLPKGGWYDYWTGHKFAGGQTIKMPVNLDSIPMFVRGGGFIFRQPAIQDTDEMPGNPLQVLIAPAKDSSSTLYEDDGETLAYRHGKFLKRTFRQSQNNQHTTIEISGPEGSYRPAARNLVLQLWRDSAPQSVSLAAGTNVSAATELPCLTAGQLTNSPSGWAYANGLLTVKTADRFVPMRFIIE